MNTNAYAQASNPSSFQRDLLKAVLLLCKKMNDLNATIESLASSVSRIEDSLDKQVSPKQEENN